MSYGQLLQFLAAGALSSDRERVPKVGLTLGEIGRANLTNPQTVVVRVCKLPPMLTRLLDHTELAMRLEPQICCFSAGRIGLLGWRAIVWHPAW